MREKAYMYTTKSNKSYWVTGSGLTKRNAHPTRLRVFSLVSLVCAVVVCLLALTALSINELVVMSNKQNVYGIAPQDSSSAAAPASPPLIPQIDASIGHLRSCVGVHCTFRSHMNGTLSLVVPANEAAPWLPTSTLRALYRVAQDQFRLGFDVAAPCGGSTRSVRAVTVFFFASTVIVAASAGVCGVASVLLQVLLSRVDVLRGLRYLDQENNRVLLGIKHADAEYFRLQTMLHLRYELPLALAVCASAVLAFVWSLCAIASVMVLVRRMMKCGTGSCTAFRNAMSALFDELRRQQAAANARGGAASTRQTSSNDLPNPSYRASCSIGLTTHLIIAVFAVAVLLVVCSVAFLVVYTRTRRTLQLRRRRDALNGFSGDFLEQQRLLETPAGASAVSPSIELMYTREKAVMTSVNSQSLPETQLTNGLLTDAPRTVTDMPSSETPCEVQLGSVNVAPNSTADGPLDEAEMSAQEQGVVRRPSRSRCIANDSDATAERTVDVSLGTTTRSNESLSERPLRQGIKALPLRSLPLRTSSAADPSTTAAVAFAGGGPRRQTSSRSCGTATMSPAASELVTRGEGTRRTDTEVTPPSASLSDARATNNATVRLKRVDINSTTNPLVQLPSSYSAA